VRGVLLNKSIFNINVSIYGLIIINHSSTFNQQPLALKKRGRERKRDSKRVSDSNTMFKPYVYLLYLQFSEVLLQPLIKEPSAQFQPHTL